ncbi:MAG: aminotransferase class I/II-fold pyridoxal phosphate-dependent enzyme, partial [Planctomycetes bacterium]|nr:aminotransferase class I/II-fold pyridoxal phosphate-dependent enzyme [Planctomycetota bacterium]
NRGRPFIYSTAPTLPAVAAARAALRVFREEPGLRATLDRHRERLGAALGTRLDSAIGRFVLGTEERALAAAEALLCRGFLVPAIRPPTVPPGTSRLRITLSAGHTAAEVAALCTALAGAEELL